MFVLCKADWKQAVERELDRCRAIARQSGMVLEQKTPEQFAGNIPVKSYAELVAMTQDTCFDSLRCCLLGQHYAQNDGFAVTEAGYAAFLQDYAATWHTTAEEARAAIVEFFQKSAVTMAVCYAGLLLFAVSFFLAVAAGATSLPRWACLCNTLPLFLAAAAFRIVGTGNLVNAGMFLGLIFLL